jgi:hypothetical protein
MSWLFEIRSANNTVLKRNGGFPTQDAANCRTRRPQEDEKHGSAGQAGCWAHHGGTECGKGYAALITVLPGGHLTFTRPERFELPTSCFGGRKSQAKCLTRCRFAVANRLTFRTMIPSEILYHAARTVGRLALPFHVGTASLTPDFPLQKTHFTDSVWTQIFILW